jgi:hypothetical protein
VRMGCDVPAPAVGRAWLLLCPSREGARGGVSVKGVRLCSVLPRLPPAPPCRGRGWVAWHARRSDACCRLQAAKCACVAVPSAGVQHVEQARDFVFVEVAPCPCGQSLAYPAPPPPDALLDLIRNPTSQARRSHRPWAWTPPPQPKIRRRSTGGSSKRPPHTRGTAYDSGWPQEHGATSTKTKSRACMHCAGWNGGSTEVAGVPWSWAGSQLTGPGPQWNRRGCLASLQRGQQANGHHEPRRSQHSFEERRLCPGLSVVADATYSLRIPTPLLCQSEIIFPILNSRDELFQPNSLWLTLLWIWSTDFIRRELPLYVNWAPATGPPAVRQRRGPAGGCRPSASRGPNRLAWRGVAR